MYVRSVATLSAKPCIVRPPLSRTPIAQIFRGFDPDGSTHTPGYSASRPASTPNDGERVDHELLDVADVAERPELVDDRQDRVADELTGAVIGDVAAAAHRDEVGADRGGVAPQVGVEVGPWPVREDVRVFEQQEVILAPVGEE